MQNEKILIIGACGQIGVELTLALRNIHGGQNVIASDIRGEHPLLVGTGPYMTLNATDKEQIGTIIQVEVWVGMGSLSDIAGDLKYAWDAYKYLPMADFSGL